MSDWNGPGFYRIEMAKKRGAHVSLAGGNPADGTKILVWENDGARHDVFAFVYAGIGKTGKHEYHIINNNSGTFLTYPEGAPEGKQLQGKTLSPGNERTRWNARLPLSPVLMHDIMNVSADAWHNRLSLSGITVDSTDKCTFCLPFKHLRYRLMLLARITPVASSKLFMNINSGRVDNGTEVWLYSNGNHESCKFYLTQAYDVQGAPFNSPDIGKAQ